MSFKNDNILRGYTSKETAYKVDNYPWGYKLRTSIFYWIETKKKFGDRLCTYTIDPRTGRACKPKYGNYYPFMWMYLDENGHVKTGHINSYETDIFKARFNYIIEHIGEEFVNEDQKYNLRIEHAGHIKGNAPYLMAKYTEGASRDAYVQWVKDTIKHILNGEFKEMTNYPDEPEQDNPEGTVQMFVREREAAPTPTEAETKPAHTITAERVTEIIKKVLPEFYVDVTERKATFGGDYLKIVMGIQGPKETYHANGGIYQAVSLSLDLKTLELITQVYGGQGGGSIYRKPNLEDPKEKYLAMKSVKVSFRRPPANEKDVLSAIERFAQNYRKALIENVDVLVNQEQIKYRQLLNLQENQLS